MLLISFFGAKLPAMLRVVLQQHINTPIAPTQANLLLRTKIAIFMF